MRVYRELPEGYLLYRRIDLQKNRRLALRVNLLSLGIAAVMILGALPFVPFSTFLDFRAPTAASALRSILLLPAVLFYVLTHEWIHGYYMKKYSGIKPSYGFTGLYAYARSDAYFDRRAYLIVGLAPVILWGMLLMILNFTLPISFFWFCYILQIINFSGAAGDFYVSVILAHMPPRILVRDNGFSMEIYARAQKAR